MQIGSARRVPELSDLRTVKFEFPIVFESRKAAPSPWALNLMTTSFMGSHFLGCRAGPQLFFVAAIPVNWRAQVEKRL